MISQTFKTNALLLVITIFVLIILSKRQESFCLCSGPQTHSLYVNPALETSDLEGPQYIKKLYTEDGVTETNIPQNGTPSDNSVAPYDNFYKVK